MTLAPSIYRGNNRRPPAGLTVEQYHRMIETGILRSGEPIELLEGQLVWKDRSAVGEDPMSVGKKHSRVIGILTSLDAQLRKLGSYMRIQIPVTLSANSEPEPDGCIVRGTQDDYEDDNPGPQEISCVIEVADSSLAEDRDRKQRIYANSGLQQYVIINLVDSVIEEYTEPEVGRGRYARVSPFPPGKKIELRTATKPLVLPVGKFLK